MVTQRSELRIPRETAGEGDAVTNDRGLWLEGVIHIQFPPPSVTLSVFVIAATDRRRPQTDALAPHTDSLRPTLKPFVQAA